MSTCESDNCFNVEWNVHSTSVSLGCYVLGRLEESSSIILKTVERTVFRGSPNCYLGWYNSIKNTAIKDKIKKE